MIHSSDSEEYDCFACDLCGNEIMSNDELCNADGNVFDDLKDAKSSEEHYHESCIMEDKQT